MPKFSALPKHIQEEKNEENQRFKSNSTSSIYVKDTIGNPNADALLHCAAIAIQIHIHAGHAAEQKHFNDIFNESLFPLSYDKIDTTEPPSVDQIYKFLEEIFRVENLPPQCCILTLAYIERLIESSGLTLHASNWKRVALAALMLASKVWEEQAVWNVDFLAVFPGATTKDLAQLEKAILNLLQFNVCLNASEYAKYYFELSSLATKIKKNLPLDPLSRTEAERLEQRSLNVSKIESENGKLQRRNSYNEFKVKSPPLVIN
eukprot:TRINITY_DN17970_c0_g1_i1.p1 TRINITY_DN17970_c0_g1~~TRINITY_DN17970_c0_g1_i1.p1  ORF type:complete len:293 (+),score=61.11 TRINITY_DN17970_c0_g1_i1:94-879(+)